MPDKKLLFIPVAAALYAAATMSMGPIFVKHLLGFFRPYMAIVCFTSLASLSLFIVLALQGKFPSFGKDNRWPALRILLFFAVFQALPGIVWFHTLPHLTGMFAVMIKRTQPLVIALLSILLVGRRLRWSDIPLSLTAIGGLYLLVGGNAQGSVAGVSLRHALLAFSSVLLWAAQFIYARRMFGPFTPVQANAIGMIGYCLAIVPFALQEGFTLHNPIGAKEVVALIFVGVGVFGIGVAAIFRALNSLEAWTVSMIMLVGPVFGAVAAYFVLRESLVFSQIGGALLILLAMAAAVWLERRPVEQKADKG